MADSMPSATISPATRNTLTAIHSGAIGEIMQLMSGLFSNIEDSLFELAFSESSDIQKRHIGELMKDLRFGKENLTKSFATRLQECTPAWWGGKVPNHELIEQRMLAQNMAGKCHAHFNHLLADIAQRAQDALPGKVDSNKVPLQPEELCYHFLVACRSVNFEKYSLDVISDLFARFVLDRLGSVYGAINVALKEAGFKLTDQTDDLSATA
ncbi:MAG: DUF1631 family protein [Pseudomonadota bacterium]